MEIENVILETISQKIGEKRFEMWFGKDIHFELHDSVLFVNLPTFFLCNWIRTNFKHIIAQACEELFGKVYAMEFLVAESQEVSKSTFVSSPNIESPKENRRNQFSQNKAESLSNASSDSVNKKLTDSSMVSSQNESLESGSNKRKKKNVGFSERSDFEQANEMSWKPNSGKTQRKNDQNSIIEDFPVYQINISKDQLLSFSQKNEEDNKEKEPIRKSPKNNRIAGINKTASKSETNNTVSPEKSKKETSGTNLGDSIKNDSDFRSLDSDQPDELFSKKASSPKKSTKNIPQKNNDRESNSLSSTVLDFPKMDSEFPDSISSRKKSSKKNSIRSSKNSLKSNPKLPSTDSLQAAESTFSFYPQDNPPSCQSKKAAATLQKPDSPKSLKTADSSKTSDTPRFLTDEKGNFNIVPHQPPKASLSNHSNAGQERDFESYSTFVVGLSNRLAKSVSDLIILEPGKMSPLMIYGSTSVGKTHLLEGIWSEYRRKANRRFPIFMTSEQFTSQFILSLRTNGQPFRNRFKNISLFVLDDIQFLEGKISTQTELLNLIDYLKGQNVQMVFSADRPLSELTGLKSEIISRIEGGIVCQIDNPERETLLGIFRQMMKKRHLNIPEDVCRFVVSRFTTHARQLSGVLNRLHASHLATNLPFSLEMAEESLKDIIRSNHRTVRLEDIEKAVKDIFGLADNSLQSRSRTKQICYPRMLAMWLARKHTRNALSEIGRYFGNRSHSTVISAQKKVDQWLQDNSPLEQGDYVWTVSETIQKIERILRH
ncbi:MAG: DnaA/Hda family protein [Planctomycetia bacterium]|nr:DnaA/Hda family protein [Planctomycetia bacterium]